MSKSSNALIFIFITILLDAIGIGITIPVMPQIIAETAKVSINEASKYDGWMFGLYALMQFLFSPLLGSLSDRYGRKSILLFSLTGFILDYLMLIFANHIVWLFIGRLIAGIMGASFTTASAYIADISPIEKRAQHFGLIGAGFGLGFIIGPALGGLISEWGLRAPFVLAATLTGLNLTFGLLVLKESLPLNERRVFDWLRANPFNPLLQLKRYPSFKYLFASILLYHTIGTIIQVTWNYYTHHKFGWDAKDVGFSLTAFGVMIALVQGLLSGWIIPKLGFMRSTIVGFASLFLGLWLFAISKSSKAMYLGIIPTSLEGLSEPSIKAAISQQMPANEQGELQGSITSLMSLASFVTPPIAVHVYFTFSNQTAYYYFPGAHFVLASVLALVAIGISYIGFKKLKPIPQ